MSSCFSLLILLHMLCGFVEISEKQRAPRNPQQYGKSAENRASETDQKPSEASFLVFGAVELRGAAGEENTEGGKSEEMRNQETGIQDSIKKASWVMAVSSALQFLASIIGIYFIWRTLQVSSASSHAAIQAVKKMEEVADENIRPWISVACKLIGNFSPAKVESGQNAYPIDLVCECENHGSSPATNVTWYAKIGLRKSVSENLSALAALCAEMKSSPATEAQTIFPKQKIQMRSGVFLLQRQIDAQEGDFFTLFVYGCVQYKSQHLEGFRQTRFAFDIVTANGILAAIFTKPAFGRDFDEIKGLNLNPLQLTDAPIISAD